MFGVLVLKQITIFVRTKLLLLIMFLGIQIIRRRRGHFVSGSDFEMMIADLQQSLVICVSLLKGAYNAIPSQCFELFWGLLIGTHPMYCLVLVITLYTGCSSTSTSIALTRRRIAVLGCTRMDLKLETTISDCTMVAY